MGSPRSSWNTCCRGILIDRPTKGERRGSPGLVVPKTLSSCVQKSGILKITGSVFFEGTLVPFLVLSKGNHGETHHFWVKTTPNGGSKHPKVNLRSSKCKDVSEKVSISDSHLLQNQREMPGEPQRARIGRQHQLMASDGFRLSWFWQLFEVASSLNCFSLNLKPFFGGWLHHLS